MALQFSCCHGNIKALSEFPSQLISFKKVEALYKEDWTVEWTLLGDFQVGNQKEYQKMVIISFVHLEKISIFCFIHKSVAQKLSLPRPLEY